MAFRMSIYKGATVKLLSTISGRSLRIQTIAKPRLVALALLSSLG